MKKSIFPFLVVLFSMPAFSQPKPETEAVMVPIRHLFEGMRLGDSARVHRGFVNEVTFATVMRDKNGLPLLRPDPFDKFLAAVGTPHAETWNEPIWDVAVQVDGNFAQVWAKYAFYLDKKFNHCGVDAFHLFKGEDGLWRIFHLADTRRRDGCDVPQAIQDQFK